MRVVLDSSVYIAAFATHGLCKEVFEYCLKNTEIFLCEDILGEVTRNLGRKLHVPTGTVLEIERLLRSNATVKKPSLVDPDACRDPNDLMVLGVANACGADCIVTGDKDLLVLESYLDTRILSPRAFWEETTRRQDQQE